MVNKQKDTIKITDKNITKVLNRPFTKRILECFNDQPKTAGEIANSISFPKDKIYYHLKKLLANNILFVASIEKVKGIEQKYFLPTAKQFDTSSKSDPKENISNSKIQIDKKNSIEQKTDAKQNKNLEPESDFIRKINDRRRKNDRRYENRRSSNNRRKKSAKNYNGNEKRKLNNRRRRGDQRVSSSRRSALDRRFTESFKAKPILEKKKNKSIKVQSIRYKNLLLKLNGITNAMTFVHSGNTVTFLLCKMERFGFNVERINSYNLPLKVKDHIINTLPDLIINVSNQFIETKTREKVYLAIHSENYHCEMTYVSARGKNKNLFKKDLLNTLTTSYGINNEHSIFDFISYSRHEKNAAVCISNKRPQISKDFKDLENEGLKLRYNTSMPQILNNIFTYYNLHHNQDYTLLIYIDRKKSHLVFSKSGQLFESKEIDKGLHYFSDALFELSVNANEENARENALHFLSYNGFSKNTSDLTIQDSIPIKKAKVILDHLMDNFIEEIKKAIFYFEKVLLHDGYSEQVINKAFTCGVGSHIKNLDKVLCDKLRMDVLNLAEYNSSFIQKSKFKKRSFLGSIRNSSLFKKKQGTTVQLESIKKRIHDHENAIETASSPESAKYRLTRLEMEKDSKLKSIESANTKLLSASKEFKHIKDEYLNDQEALKEDVNSISSMIEEQSHILIDKYKEQEDVGKKISELEYAIDQSKNFKEEASQEKKGRYQLKVKHAAQSRAKVSDEKESLDQEIDSLEMSILKLEENLHEINKRIENGNDEISIFEYLKDSIQATANAFKRSFIERLRSIEKLTDEDFNNLQRSEYLLVQNTKRIDEIRESFSSMISGDLKLDQTNLIDNDNGKEIKKKLLKILSLVIEAPDNLIHLKNLTGSIIKINESQNDMISKISEIDNQKIEAKRSIKYNKKNLIALNKDIKTNEIDLEKKIENRQEKVEILQHVRQTIEWINDLDHHMVLIKELKPQLRSQQDEINNISNRISRLDSLKESCQNSLDKLELKHAELKYSIDKEKKNINENTKSLSDKEEAIKKELDENLDKRDSIKEKISNAWTYIDQLEKQVVTKNNEIKSLKIEAKPIYESFEFEKNKLTKEFDEKINFYDIEYDKKIIETKKTKEITLGVYFKKQVIELRKKQKEIEKSILKSKKEKDKAKLDKEKANTSLLSIKKKNLPQISKISMDIKSWERDLIQGRRFQERLENLDAKKSDWDNQLEQERDRITEQLSILQNSIKRKKSKPYRLFLKDGLNRFQKNGDPEEIATAMAEDSISMDLEEINKLEQELEQFMSRYNHFMARYRKNQRDILKKLRPFGGRKKVILTKIQKAKVRIKSLESMIKKWVDKVDEKNEILIKKQEFFLETRDKGKRDKNNINSEIKNMPYKKDRAKSEVEQRLKNRLRDISEKKKLLEEDKNKSVSAIHDVFKREKLIEKIDEKEDRMIFFLKEIEHTKEKIESLKKDEKSLIKSTDLSDKGLENIFKKHDLNQTILVKIDDEFKRDSSKLLDKISSHQSELSILDEQILSLQKQKDENMTYLKKIENDYKQENDSIHQLKKDIKIFDANFKSRIGSEVKGKKRITRKDKLRYLLQIEKDVVIDLDRFESIIKDLNILIDSMQNERSEIESSISLMENDINYYESDHSRIKTLIENNKAHIIKISTDHRRALNGISNVKELYPPSKIMLNERITDLYTHLELKTRDRDELKIKLEEIHSDLKNKRIEAAVLEQNLKNINDNMKNALESSFYENEESDSDLKWDLPENKMNSYMDLAQLKIQSKGLSNSIAEKEEDIAKLKNQLSSINNVLSEKEKMGHKKIKMMEERCTKLELQITKEKNELNGLEQEVKQLTGFAFNYGDRIDILEKELKDFREKQTEYEITLKDLDRALETINEKANGETMEHSSLKSNSIQMDYMANLGLLMDPDLRLNLIPSPQKKDFKYFRPNQILQNVVLILITVFSLGSFFQRSKVQKLNTILPLKQSELSLLNMRQEMEEVVFNKNLIADRFSKMIEDDKVSSKNMVSMMKYLSYTIPKNFWVTDMNIEKLGLINDHNSKEFKYSDLVMTIDGFFDKNQSRASNYIEIFKKDILKDNQFKSFEVLNNKKSKDNRANYTIKIVR